jgi:hypothetical protein
MELGFTLTFRHTFYRFCQFVVGEVSAGLIRIANNAFTAGR